MLREIFRVRKVRGDLQAIQKASDKLLGEDLITMDEAVEIRQAARLKIEHDNCLKLSRVEAQALARLSDAGNLSIETRGKVQKLVSKRQPRPFRANGTDVTPLYTRRLFLGSAGLFLGSGALATFCIKDMMDHDAQVSREVDKILETAQANSRRAAAQGSSNNTIEGLAKSYEDKARMDNLRKRLYNERLNSFRMIADAFGFVISFMGLAAGGVGTVAESKYWRDESDWKRKRYMG